MITHLDSTCPHLVELNRLKAESDEVLEDFYNEVESALKCQPKPNGEYAHLVYCNGDPRKPPGTPGVSCSCPVGRVWREAAAKIVEAAPRCRMYVCGRNEIAEAVRQGKWTDETRWTEEAPEKEPPRTEALKEHYGEECAYTCPKHSYR